MAPRRTGEGTVGAMRRTQARLRRHRVPKIALFAFIVLQTTTGTRNRPAWMPGAQAIGQVQDLTGEAFSTRPDGARVRLNARDPVFQGDVIETAGDAAISLLFFDETTISLGDDARLALNELVYNPATRAGQSPHAIVKGVLVFVSGKIAKANSGQMTATTPIATIGIRG